MHNRYAMHYARMMRGLKCQIIAVIPVILVVYLSCKEQHYVSRLIRTYDIECIFKVCEENKILMIKLI